MAMTVTQIATDYAAAFSRWAEDVQVRRYSGTGVTRTSADTPGRARVTGFAPSELIAGIVQGDRKVILKVDAAIAAILPLTTADKIVVRGRECGIKAVDNNTRRVGVSNLFAVDIVASA